MTDGLFILGGLLLLFVGGEALIRGAVSISKRLGISPILIGLVVLGFGTSAPELLVVVRASLAGQSDIALGSVVGSNIANILFILGASAVICPIICSAQVIKRDALAVLAVSALLFALPFWGTISAVHGTTMIAALLVYLLYSYKAEMRDKGLVELNQTDSLHEQGAQERMGTCGLGVSVLMSVTGIALLVYGADFLLEGASNLARQAGISDEVIGLTLVAVGTSLPELAASISAAFKKNSDIIIGNILGSNLFNITGILGLASIIKPITFSEHIARFDAPLNLVISLLMLLIIFTLQRISRLTGGLFIATYAAYIAWLYIH